MGLPRAEPEERQEVWSVPLCSKGRRQGEPVSRVKQPFSSSAFSIEIAATSVNVSRCTKAEVAMLTEVSVCRETGESCTWSTVTAHCTQALHAASCLILHTWNTVTACCSCMPALHAASRLLLHI